MTRWLGSGKRWLGPDQRFQRAIERPEDPELLLRHERCRISRPIF